MVDADICLEVRLFREEFPAAVRTGDVRDDIAVRIHRLRLIRILPVFGELKEEMETVRNRIF